VSDAVRSPESVGSGDVEGTPDPAAHRVPSKAPTSEIADEASHGFLSLGASTFHHQSFEHGSTLSRDPRLRDLPGQGRVVGVFVVEDPADRLERHLTRHALRAKLGRQRCPAPWPVAKSVSYECRGDGFVVDEPSVLEPIETEVDSCRTKALAEQAASQFGSGASAVRDQIQGGVSDAQVFVIVQEVVLAGSGQGIADAEAVALQRFEHDLEGLAAIEVNADLQPSWFEGLDAGDERRGGRRGHF